MFDWNDEEITKIIWGEAGESDDHIVPYPEPTEGYSKKSEWKQESDTIKSNGQKALGLDVDFHVRKLGDCSSIEHCKGTSFSRFHMDSWPNLSVSNDANAHQHSLNDWVSKESTEFTNLDSLGAEGAQVNKDSGSLENSKGHEGQGELIDYGWDGSFDDLDQIFSYDGSMYGNVNLSNPDEIWSSSKDVSNGTEKSFVESQSFGFGALQDTSENFEFKAECLLEDDHAFTLGFGEDSSSSHLLNACATSNASDFVEGESKHVMKDQKDGILRGKGTQTYNQTKAEHVVVQDTPRHKACKQNKLLKCQKKHEEDELKSNQEFYGNWSSSAELAGPCRTQIAPAVLQLSSSVVSHQTQLRGAEPLLYQRVCNPVVPPATYGHNANSCSAVPALSQIPLREHQSLFSGCDVSSDATEPLPVNKRADSPRQVHYMTPQEKVEKLRQRQQMQADSPRKLQNMTPQEKIEKLRRRQQIRAMLAIQKQLQQLGQQVCSSDPSITHCSQENQFHHIDGANLDVEGLSTPQTWGTMVPIEQDVCSTSSQDIDDYSAKNEILCQLQDVISNLDVRLRLCMRNSLFRLAQSAVQRRFATDNNSTNKMSTDDQFASGGENNSSRDAQMLDVETDTNPVDRTVAHLLFYRPIASSGKNPDTPDSPASATLSAQHMAKSSVVSSMSSLNKHGFSIQGSGTSLLLSDPQPINQGKASVCIGTTETTPNRGPADDETRDVMASQQKEGLLSFIGGQNMSESGC